MQRGMRGHVIIYPQKSDTLLTVLPPSVENVCTPICVIFVGSHRPSQDWLRRHATPLIVHRERIRAALIWLKAHNHLYRNVAIDNQTLEAFPVNDVLPVHIELVEDEVDANVLTSRYDVGQETVSDTGTAQHNPNLHAADKTIFDSVVVTGLAEDATLNQMRAAAIMHMKEKNAGFLQIPHSSRPSNEFYDPNLLPMTYPTLFPYGLGGFENLERTSSLSFKRQVKHFFSLADSRFQEHYSFLFMVFNILQRRVILLQTSLKVKHSSFDSFAREFQGISSEAIRNVCDRLSHQSNNNSMFECTTPEERRILQLMKEVNVINSHVPGSSAARIVMRNEIRALIMEKGLPSFYITINPADVYNPLVKFLAGSNINIDELLPEQVPNYMQQSILVAKNPFVAARFFNIYLKAFLNTVLGYDGSDTTKIGVLGTVSAHYGCVEAQGRGTLHCHMLVWLKDALNCDEIRNRVLAGDNQFQTQMISFIDNCISNEIPPIPTESVTIPSDNVHPCSVRGIVDLHADVARRKDLHNIVKACQSHKHSATCYKYWKRGQPRECRFGLGEHRNQKNTEFDSTGELQMRCLDGLVNNFNNTMIELMHCNMDIQFLGSGPSTKAVIYYITDYITKAQLKTHVAYAALALAVQKLEQTVSTDDLPTVRAKKLLQKCAFSMIAQQELSGQQVASYLVDLEDHFSSHEFEPMYWTTYENLVNKIFPIAHSNPDRHLHQHVSGDDVDEDATSLTDDEENVEDDANSLEDIHVVQSDGDDHVIVSANNIGELQIHTPYIQDYLLRGAALKHLSIWEYTSMIEKISKKRARYHEVKDETKNSDFASNIDTTDDSHTRPKYAFNPSHPDYDTHIQQLRRLNNRPIPTLIGPSLPRRDKTESREKYCRLMLLLLKPWNAPEDLIVGYNNFEAAFQTFLQENDKWKLLLKNMQLLHECRDNRDNHFQIRSRARNMHESFERQGNGSNDNDDFEANDPDTINIALLEHLMSIDDSRSLHLSESQDTVDQCLQEVHLHGLLDQNDEEITPDSVDTLGVLTDNDILTQEQDWLHEYE